MDEGLAKGKSVAARNLPDHLNEIRPNREESFVTVPHALGEVDEVVFDVERIRFHGRYVGEHGVDFVVSHGLRLAPAHADHVAGQTSGSIFLYSRWMLGQG